MDYSRRAFEAQYRAAVRSAVADLLESEEGQEKGRIRSRTMIDYVAEAVPGRATTGQQIAVFVRPAFSKKFRFSDKVAAGYWVADLKAALALDRDEAGEFQRVHFDSEGRRIHAPEDGPETGVTEEDTTIPTEV